MATISIIMGSTSDFPIMEDAVKFLNEIGIDCDYCALSAHRTPELVMEFAKNAKQNGTKVIIAGAGGAAHLPGMVAAMTTLPVIGVPVKSRALNGLDSLLSIVQMPGGVPVLTVAINGAKNAALSAVAILATSDAKLSKKLKEYRKNQTESVLQANLDE